MKRKKKGNKKMKNLETKITDMTNAFIGRLVCIEREYWLAHEMELNDYSAAIEYGDSIYYAVYKDIDAKGKAIEKELIAFQEKYELSDLFIDTIYQIAIDEFKLEKKI